MIIGFHNKYEIAWFPSMKHLFYLMKNAPSEYWLEPVAGTIKRVDCMPTYMMMAIILSVFVPFLIRKVK